MKTRRNFLQGSSMMVASSLAAGKITAAARDTAVGEASKSLRDYWNDYPAYLTAVVNEARARRKADLSKLKVEKDVVERIAFIRKNIWELTGGPLEHTPVNAQLGSVIERESHRVQKLVFESQPNFYVPAHLYLPKSGKGPFPGIIAPLGHTPDGKAYQSYQTAFQNLAAKGFVVLTWDPPGQGERLQYLVPGTNQSRFGPTGEHNQFGWPAFLVGSTTTQFETWDAVQALNYLLTRPEVDGKRIGCCGHSGGGTATMYLCALEPRIQAAVVVEGHTENVAGANYEPPGAFADAEQNIIGSLKIGLDRGDLLCAFAPRPLLLCYTRMDIGTTYSPHYEAGIHEIHAELKDQYRLYRAEEKVGLSVSSLPHDYDFFHRRATYQWFNRWLNNKADDSEAAFEKTPEGDLNCTSTGQILTSIGGKTAYQINFDKCRTLGTRSPNEKSDQGQLQQNLRQVLQLSSPGATALDARSLSLSDTGHYIVEEFEYSSEKHIRVPGFFLKPKTASKSKVVIVVSDRGKNHLFDDAALLALVAEGKTALCTIDVRASGQTTPHLPVSGPLFYNRSVEMAYSLVSLTAGVPLAGQRVYDILRCLDYLKTRDDVDTAHISMVGRGATGLEALYSAALDGRISSLLLEKTLTDFRSLVQSADYDLKVASFPFGLLKHFDLPEICSSIAPRPVWLLNPVDPEGQGVSISRVLDRYGSTRDRDHFAVHVDVPESGKVFKEWLLLT